VVSLTIVSIIHVRYTQSRVQCSRAKDVPPSQAAWWEGKTPHEPQDAHEWGSTDTLLTSKQYPSFTSSVYWSLQSHLIFLMRQILAVRLFCRSTKVITCTGRKREERGESLGGRTTRGTARCR
jgi:hypothetical protein